MTTGAKYIPVKRIGEQALDCLPQDALDDWEIYIVGEVAWVVIGEVAGDAARCVVGGVLPFIPQDKGDVTRVADS
jgi:hypothetical protein